MDAFVTRQSRKRKREIAEIQAAAAVGDDDDESTEVKLALLVSLLDGDGNDVPDQATLLDILLAHDGNVTAAVEACAQCGQKGPKRSLTEAWGGGAVGQQMSLRALFPGSSTKPPPPLPPSSTHTHTQRTLFLYDPVDIAAHTPCTLIPNFLPTDLANALLRELLDEAATFGTPHTFKLFDRAVASPHTSRLYLESSDEAAAAVTAGQQEAAGTFRLTPSVHEGYRYNGARLRDVRPCPPQMLRVRPLVQAAVRDAVRQRVAHRNNSKLRYQPPPDAWRPNAAVVNCYDGPQESVGWHCDQMTYLGPRAVIGSLSLGVAREFRVRRIVPGDDDNDGDDGHNDDGQNADTRQFSIYLPHNSLLVMHAEMQECWKHSVPTVASVEPHPLAGNKRINITYRHYRAEFHPNLTPRCHCGIATVLRVVQRKRKTYGRYFWICHAGSIPGRDGCSFFQWAEFDGDGNPIWRHRQESKDQNTGRALK